VGCERERKPAVVLLEQARSVFRPLVYGGISYSRQRTVLEVGSFKATATEQKNIPVSPIVGGIVLVIGVALVYGVRGIVGRAWENLTVELQRKGAV